MARLLRVSRMKCAAGSAAATGIRVGLSAPKRESVLRFTATSKHLPLLRVAARRRRRLVRHGKRLHGPGRTRLVGLADFTAFAAAHFVGCM